MTASSIACTPPRQASSRLLWRNRAFMTFAAGDAVSLFGTAMATIAMPLLVLRMTGSVQQMGLIATLMSAGSLLAALIGGAIIDRFDRFRVRLVCCFASAALFLTIPVMWYVVGPSMWLLRLIALPIGFFELTAFVAMAVSLANFVAPEQITRATSVFGVCQSVATLLGPMVAGYITVRFGGVVVMALNAASFLALAAALLSLRAARSATTPRPAREPAFWKSAVRGLHYVWENRLLFWATVIRLAGLCFTLGSVDLMVYHLQHEAMLSPSAVGLLLSAGACGGLCGNLLTPVLRERLGFSPLYLGGIALSGISLACFGLSQQFGVLLICAVTFSFGDALATISGYSLRMQITPEPLQGRVFSAFQAMIYAGGGVSIALATTLAARIGAGVTLALLGALVALVAAAGLKTPMRYRRPERHARYAEAA